MTFTRKRPQRRAALLLLLAAAALLVAGCTDFNIRTAFPPDAASTQGQATRNLYDIVFLIGIAIFLLVEGLILFAVLRYRRRKGDDELPPQIHGNNKLEIIWTAIPIAIVLALFVVSWQTLNTIDARKENPPVRDRRRRLPVAVAVRVRARRTSAGRTAARPRTRASASPSSACRRPAATGRAGRRRRCTSRSARRSSCRCTPPT